MNILTGQASSPTVGTAVPRNFDLSDVPVSLIGAAAEWFDVEVEDDAAIVRPRRSLPARCTIRPAALFWQERGFWDINTVMGRLLFAPRTLRQQRYRPFTLDPRRELRELFLLVEPTPEDDLPASTGRWSNYETVTRRLMELAGVSWNGLLSWDVDDLMRLEPWLYPLEGCALHALAQSSHAVGSCVLEVGSLRGQSTAMLAMALRDVHSDSFVVSIDPHADQPLNREQARLTLAQIGEERRLVQFTCPSDAAWPILRERSASLIFIDGDHSYGQVITDFENYAPLLAPGGCLVFHDYGYGPHNGRPDVVPDVRRVIDEHVLPQGKFRPLLLAHTLLALVNTGD